METVMHGHDSMEDMIRTPQICDWTEVKKLRAEYLIFSLIGHDC